MALLIDAVKRLMTSLTSQSVGNTVADAINKGEAFATQSGVVVAAAITATATSQTTDFGALKVNDLVFMIPATAGNADFIGPIGTAGNLGQAAVIGNLYVVLRAFSAPAASAVKF